MESPPIGAGGPRPARPRRDGHLGTAPTRDGAATYVYCLMRSGAAPPLAQAPRGLPGAGRPRALRADGSVWIVAADAPLSRYGSGPIERGLEDLRWVSACAIGHEAVVEFCAARAPTIPLKLFTLFSTDDRALRHIRGRRGALERVFRRVAGRQEWGLRLYFDPVRARPGPGREAGRRARAGGAGTQFLLRKRQERERLGGLIQVARRQAGRTFREFARHADGARRRPLESGGPVQGSVCLDAAFLVSARRAARFQTAARNAGARLARDGYRLALTGPWPPYHFVGGRP